MCTVKAPRLRVRRPWTHALIVIGMIAPIAKVSPSDAAGAERSGAVAKGPGSTRIQAPSQKPSYATELPKAEPAAEGDTIEESTSVTKMAPMPAEEEERPGIDAPVMIEDINVAEQGELEVQITFDWSTKKFGQSKNVDKDDTVLYNIYEIKYGLASNLEVGLSLPIDIGDGHVTGNGDLEIIAKYCLWRDKDWYPGFAVGAAIRAPSGVDSSGVDGELNLILTKSFGLHRVHVNGMLKTANGHNIEELRHFQWAVGVGYDHPIIDSKTLFIADYFCRSSEQDGVGNVNTLELGIQRELIKHHTLGASIRVGLDDHDETPDIGVGVKYVFGTK